MSGLRYARERCYVSTHDAGQAHATYANVWDSDGRCVYSTGPHPLGARLAAVREAEVWCENNGYAPPLDREQDE